MQNQYASVTDTYKSFYGFNFFVPKYDVTYRNISFHRTLIELNPIMISYEPAYHDGYFGNEGLWKCRYEIH